MLGEINENKQKKWRILIADDHVDTTEVLKVRFQIAGCEVVTAYNGADAFDRFRESTDAGHEIDLCVLDYEMPQMKGDVAAVAILELCKEKNILAPQMLIFTGSTDQNLILRLNAAEIGIILIKPHGLDELEKFIHRFETAQKK